MKIKLLLLCTMFAIASISCKKDPDGGGTTPLPDVELKSKVLLAGLTLPWEILYGPDNMIWMTEKGGEISRVNPSNGQVTPVLTIGDVRVNGEGGLLGMVLHPDFNTTPYVYVVYGYGNPYKNKVVRYTYGNNTLSSPLILLDQIPANSTHNGSRLLINGDKLFITTGDAADQSLPQNNNSLAGKILRINLDGSIPADNPIANNAMWTKGHRNPQGLVMVGNKLFEAEHGPDVEDEVNIIEKGKNYGWPNIKTDIVAPIISWTPTIAPSGLTYYNSDYIPQFKNSLLVAILKDSKIVQLKLDDAQTKVVGNKDFYVKEYDRLRDFAISPEGKIYVCTSNGSDDKIVEISK